MHGRGAGVGVGVSVGHVKTAKFLAYLSPSVLVMSQGFAAAQGILPASSTWLRSVRAATSPLASGAILRCDMVQNLGGRDTNTPVGPQRTQKVKNANDLY